MIEDAILTVNQLKLQRKPYHWAFAQEEADRIAAHWAARCKAKPKLYDGRVLLMQEVSVADGCLDGAFFETGFSNFLSWKELGFPGVPIANVFGMAALRAADGAFMLGEMSGTTSTAGRLYFPAGTPEPDDVDASGRIDFEANVLRELAEETGLGSDDVDVDAGWTAVVTFPFVACMKLIRAHETTAALRARLADFNAAQDDPELVDLYPVTGAADYDDSRMPAFMIRYFDWVFAQAR